MAELAADLALADAISASGESRRERILSPDLRRVLDGEIPNPLIVREFLHQGHVVREQEYADRLGWLPPTYFICPADRICEVGTGRSAAEAVADKLAKREREAA
jgi:hypothetical protein